MGTMDVFADYASPNVVGGAASVAAATLGYHILDSKIGLSHDLKLGIRLGPLLRELQQLATKEYTITDVWQNAVARWGNRTAIVFENRRMSFLDMERTAVQMAHWLLKKGLQKNQTVSLYMENKPEFICWWLAATRLGIKVALLNYSIKQKGLLHCAKVGS